MHCNICSFSLVMLVWNFWDLLFGNLGLELATFGTLCSSSSACTALRPCQGDEEGHFCHFYFQPYTTHRHHPAPATQDFYKKSDLNDLCHGIWRTWAFNLILVRGYPGIGESLIPFPGSNNWRAPDSEDVMLPLLAKLVHPQSGFVSLHDTHLLDTHDTVIKWLVTLVPGEEVTCIVHTYNAVTPKCPHPYPKKIGFLGVVNSISPQFYFCFLKGFFLQ